MEHLQINARSEIGRTIIVPFILELEVPMFISILIPVQIAEIYNPRLQGFGSVVEIWDRNVRIPSIADAGEALEFIK